MPQTLSEAAPLCHRRSRPQTVRATRSVVYFYLVFIFSFFLPQSLMTTATGVTVVEQQKPVESKATTADNTASTGEARGSVSKIVAEQPLHNKWVLWYDNPKAALPNTDWRENLQFCGRFDTPAKFWQIFNNVKPPSQIGDKCNYHIFKEGIEPMWEDPKNENGGKWVLTITKTSNNKSRVDEFWLFTCLAVIGETIDFAGDMVCGAVVSIRRNQDRIALWIKTDEPNIVSQIGARWKKAMDVPNRLKYQVHRDAAQSGHSFRNDVIFEV